MLNVFYLLLISIPPVILFFAEYYDNRRPLNSWWRHKFKVKENSFLRKIFRLKDNAYYPCNYFKVIPVYISTFITSVILLITIVVILYNINILITKKFLFIFAIIYYAIVIIYLLFLILWWEILDYLEFRKYNSKNKKR